LTFSINQVKAELAILQADMKDCEAFEATKRMNDEELKARAHDIATSLEAVEEQELQGGPRQSPWLWNGCALSPSAFALHRTELLEDLRCIGVQLSHSAPENERMHKERVRQGQQRLKAWELSGEVGTLRHAQDMVKNTLQKRTESKHICCTECKMYKVHEKFRREENRMIVRSRRCLTCEFPYCEACGRQRQKSEGPVLVNDKRPHHNWYCDQFACQAAQPRQCEGFCKEWKPKEAYKIDAPGGGNIVQPCLACKYPTCRHCGNEHKAPGRAVQANSPCWVEGVGFFCTNTEYRLARVKAQQKVGP
jgi:hypothetical protein